MWATEALSRISDRAEPSIEPEGLSAIQMADMGTVAFFFTSMPSATMARPDS